MRLSFIKVTAIAVTLFSLLSCSSKIEKKELLERKSALETYSLLKEFSQKKDIAIKEFIQTLSVEEKLSQIFLINLERNDEFLPVEWYQKESISSDGKIKIEKKTLIPSGYIFFGYNISDKPKQIIGFTDSILEHAVKQGSIPPFLSVDVEGGFVNRLRGVAGPLPENERVSQCLTPGEAYNLYSYYANQMSALGFNMNLAPVAEICTEKNADFLNGRSYGTESNVKQYVAMNINAYQNRDVGTVVKHFPGNTNIDPHIGLPKMEMTEEKFALVKDVFSFTISEKPEGILMSHVIVPQYDNVPACLSKLWITKILTEEMHYKGIIFSDDIFMGALIDNGYPPEKASKMAIEAGINCIMISEKKFGHWMNVLKKNCNDTEFMRKIDESVFRILQFKMNHDLINCTYNPDSDSFSVSLKTLEDYDFSSENTTRRCDVFNSNKKNTMKMYKQFFYSTASDEEKRGLFIDRTIVDE